MTLKNFLKTLVSPVSKDEDRARSEFIFHILLLSSILLTSCALLINLIDLLRGKDTSVSVGVIFVIFLFFSFLYFLSRKGYVYSSSVVFLAAFFIVVTLMQYTYGVDLPMEILSYALIIVMAGILINTRVAFGVTFLLSASIAIIGYLQKAHIIEANRYWINELWKTQDIIIASVLLSIIAIVSWLSNREIEKSLVRARQSEAELMIERDSLEVKVEERTRAIKEMQLEKMGQLYRFAEFGRLSSGLFHDLMNPLTAVSLNMEMVKQKEHSSQEGNEVKTHLERALSATRKMEDFVMAVRKQISKQEHIVLFSLNEEIRQVIEILSFKATKARVGLVFAENEDFELYGDNIKMSQVILNLLINAIDAYKDAEKQEQTVTVSLKRDMGRICFSVTDQGAGIVPENLTKIFEPFFSTKGPESGMGIGLSLVKKIIEKDFGGTIEVRSLVGEGTQFVITISERRW